MMLRRHWGLLGAGALIMLVLTISTSRSPLPWESGTAGQSDEMPLLLPAPPDRPPTAMLLGTVPSALERQGTQPGRLIGFAWVIEGTPTEALPKSPIDWPPLLPLASNTVTLIIETPVLPTRVRLLLKRSPHKGVAFDAIELNCGQRGWEALGGDRPDCVIEEDVDGGVARMTIDLPDEPGEWYFSAEGIWMVPPMLPGADQLPLHHAWWAFAVRVDGASATPTAPS